MNWIILSQIVSLVVRLPQMNKELTEQNAFRLVAANYVIYHIRVVTDCIGRFMKKKNRWKRTLCRILLYLDDSFCFLSLSLFSVANRILYLVIVNDMVITFYKPWWNGVLWTANRSWRLIGCETHGKSVKYPCQSKSLK